MTKLSKMHIELNEAFRLAVPEAMFAQFGIEVETHFNFFHMALITKRKDGQPLTVKQANYLRAYEAGYVKAMSLVQYRDAEDERAREMKKEAAEAKP